MKIFAGTSGYGYKEWKGKFYPEKISSRDMLRYYSGLLNVVEINNTFYHMPKQDVLAAWAEQVPDDFIFAFKAPQLITHFKQLKNVDADTDNFFTSLSVLGPKLGPVLFQFPKSFREDRARLEDFLHLLPGRLDCAFEFRSPTWHEGKTLDLLREYGCSLCIADTDENLADKIIATARWGYLRLRRSDYTDADLSVWMERILEQRWEKAFVFFKHEEEAKGPEMAMGFLARIRSQARRPA